MSRGHAGGAGSLPPLAVVWLRRGGMAAATPAHGTCLAAPVGGFTGSAACSPLQGQSVALATHFARGGARAISPPEGGGFPPVLSSLFLVDVVLLALCKSPFLLAFVHAVQAMSFPERSQIAKAAAALKKHVASRQAGAADGPDDAEKGFLYLQIALRTMPTRARPKPSLIHVPHPIYAAGETEVCLIVRDSDHSLLKQMVSADATLSRMVTNVVSVSQLKKDYKSFESKRLLLHSFDLFVCQDAVMSSLSRALGKKFFEAKKQPLVVSSKSGKLLSELESVLHAVSFTLMKGTTVSLRIARIGMSPEEVADNVLEALPHIKSRMGLPIQALHLKGKSTASLPIWNSTLLSNVQRDAPKPDETESQSADSGKLSGISSTGSGSAANLASHSGSDSDSGSGSGSIQASGSPPTQKRSRNQKQAAVSASKPHSATGSVMKRLMGMRKRPN